MRTDLKVQCIPIVLFCLKIQKYYRKEDNVGFPLPEHPRKTRLDFSKAMILLFPLLDVNIGIIKTMFHWLLTNLYVLIFRQILIYSAYFRTGMHTHCADADYLLCRIQTLFQM